MDLQYHNFLRESFRCRKQIDISVPVKFTDFGIQTPSVRDLIIELLYWNNFLGPRPLIFLRYEVIFASQIASNLALYEIVATTCALYNTENIYIQS